MRVFSCKQLNPKSYVPYGSITLHKAYAFIGTLIAFSILQGNTVLSIKK